ncbi:MAG TPA: 5'/3'-nucleotidase SurE [Polyangiaceae bacterium]
MARPLVLLSNDDGYRAQGIQLLKHAISAWADVVICAPEMEQSTTSHSLSLYRPLRLVQVSDSEYAVDGTPADCVYVALHGARVLPRPPDLVVSGLNHGLNLGNDVFYSGTVAAAREAALKGFVALAVSADMRADFEKAAAMSASIARGLLGSVPSSPALGRLFNVNFPSHGSWKPRSTRLGRRFYRDEVEFRRDPRGREYLWIGGAALEHDLLEGSDTEAYDRGEVGITPLVLDLWDPGGSAQAAAVVAAVSTEREQESDPDAC